MQGDMPASNPPMAFVVQPAVQDPTQLYSLRSKVDTWSTVVKVVGVLLLVYGAFKTFGSVAGLLFIGVNEGVQIKGQDCDMDFDMPTAPALFEKVLGIAAGLLLLIQGRLAWNSSKNKTRADSWLLVKRSMWMMLGHLVI